MKKIKETKGITLIALVVTIVVLLILAGVSINLILDNNGVIAKAKDTKEKQIVAGEKDQISLAYAACRTGENYLATTISSEEMETNLKELNQNVTVTEDGDNLKITFTDTQHKYTIAQNGEIGDLVDWSQLAPGLYETGTANMIKSWEELMIEMYGENNIKENGTPAVIERDAFNKIEETGDLIISSEITKIYRYGATCGNMTKNDKITGVYIPKETDLNDFGYGFSYFLNLKKVVYGDGCTTTGRCPFYGCNNITSVTLPSTLTTISEEAFRDCTALKKIDIPDSVTSIESYAFFNCTSLEEITIGDDIKTMGTNAFYGTAWYNKQPDGAVYIGKVLYSYKGDMPENTVLRIKDGTKIAAAYCFDPSYDNNASLETNLIEVVLPEGFEILGKGAFLNSKNMTTMTIPKSLKEIQDMIFGTWIGSKLATINYKGTQEEWRKITIGEKNDAINNVITKGNINYNYTE